MTIDPNDTPFLPGSAEQQETSIDRTSFRVGSWKVEADLQRISDGGTVHQLEPKVLQVLLCLCAHRGRVVDREHLTQEVWPDTIVGDDPLNRAISELRKIFRDAPRQPRYIETIHKKGYRLIASVSPLAAPPAPPTLPAPAKVSPSKRWNLATLPLLALVLILGAWGAKSWWPPFRQAAPPGAEPAPPRTIPITSYPGRERQPALSPDGQRVVYTWAGTEGKSLDIYLEQLESDRPLRLTKGASADTDPAWSPDGTTVAFARTTPDHFEIRGVPAIGGAQRILYTSTAAYALGFDWSPDARHLVVSDQGDPGKGFRLFLVSLETGERNALTAPSGHQADLSPRFSPDGETVAFIRILGRSVREVFLIPTDGTTARPLTSDGLDIAGVDWTVDGEDLIYSSNRNGVYGLWRQPRSGGAAQWLGYESAFVPSVGPSGLVFEQRRQDVGIWRQPLDPADTVKGSSQLISSTRADLEPQVSPDGSQIAFVSNRTGSHELWVAGENGETPRQLTSSQTPVQAWRASVQHPRWSPDGQNLVYSTRREEGLDIYTVATDGSSPKALVAHPAEDRAPCWDPGAPWIYFVSDRGGARQIWRVPEEGGEPTRVSKTVVAPMLSCPLIGELYFQSQGDREIRRLRILEEGIQEESTGFSPDSTDWTATAAGLYGFVDSEGPGLALAHFDPVAGEVVSQVPLAEGLPAGGIIAETGGLTVHEAGRWALYTRVEENESDIVFVKGFR